MMMMLILAAMKLELDALLEDDLLEHAQLLHDSQIPVDGIKAKAGIGFAHVIVNILRRQIARRFREQLRKRFALIRNAKALAGHSLYNFIYCMQSNTSECDI